jgi:hypothetical protein
MKEPCFEVITIKGIPVTPLERDVYLCISNAPYGAKADIEYVSSKLNVPDDAVRGVVSKLQTYRIIRSTNSSGYDIW